MVMGFPGGSAGNESACYAGDLGLIPGLGRSPREVNGYLLQYSGLENSMDCIVHGVAKSRTRLSDFHFQCIYGIYSSHSLLPRLCPQVHSRRLNLRFFPANRFILLILFSKSKTVLQYCKVISLQLK